mgnify:CR=1 FL=1
MAIEIDGYPWHVEKLKQDNEKTKKNKKTIYESHAPIYEETIYGLRFFNRLIKSKYFKKLVVISQALKDIYLENGFLETFYEWCDDNGIDIEFDENGG